MFLFRHCSCSRRGAGCCQLLNECKKIKELPLDAKNEDNTHQPQKEETIMIHLIIFFGIFFRKPIDSNGIMTNMSITKHPNINPTLSHSPLYSYSHQCHEQNAENQDKSSHLLKLYRFHSTVSIIPTYVHSNRRYVLKKTLQPIRCLLTAMLLTSNEFKKRISAHCITMT